MKQLIAALGCCLALSAQAENTVVSDHERIARSWLDLVDHGDYNSSWREAGETFQHRISQHDWLNVIEYARDPLGKPISRELISTPLDADSAIRNATVRLDFRTDFENRHVATERVTLRRTESHWQVSGYLIH